MLILVHFSIIKVLNIKLLLLTYYLNNVVFLNMRIKEIYLKKKKKKMCEQEKAKNM